MEKLKEKLIFKDISPNEKHGVVSMILFAIIYGSLILLTLWTIFAELN
jgi:hypothetical protein